MNRGSTSGSLTRANFVRFPCLTTTAKFLLRFEINGNGWPGSNASGVRTGQISRVKYAPRNSRICGVHASRSRNLMCSAASSSRSSFQHDAWSSICFRARERIAYSCCSVLYPSGATSSIPSCSFFNVVATRIMKNSSRFVPTIERNFRRSSSGCAGSVAWARTRSLNSSQLSSRLMYNAGFLRSPGSICVSAARGGITRSAGLARVVGRDRRSVRSRRSATAASPGESISIRWWENEAANHTRLM